MKSQSFVGVDCSEKITNKIKLLYSLLVTDSGSSFFLCACYNLHARHVRAGWGVRVASLWWSHRSMKIKAIFLIGRRVGSSS